jgi:nicotinamide mononucleotide transporter
MTTGTAIEIAAVLLGIATVALTVRQHIVSWPTGIVSSALFLLLFLEAGLYADSLLQVLYVGLGLYGWWHWLHGGPSRNALPVTRASTQLRLALVADAIVATAAFGALLDATTDSTVPYPDAATTVLSVVAQILLTRKKVENWPIWIFGVNIPYIAIYLYKGLALTAGLQVLFIALSFAGWRAWRRSMATPSAAAPPPQAVASEAIA